ncbi:TOMM precursor leader peptide-binding protein [Streptomyces sp. J2-1]|uniref:TOMM precursor leader peptide-binding protein n=1 Tax=Streptomyces corallincola TaxID=2851888 RepID=UPI001C393A38|nr:TOMM precursor leader peptide-binding protein [Streptomyces corallincola]MBV2353991.1 TOMM precursor leader peptide-binding protein [Streptomyces corallincola]
MAHTPASPEEIAQSRPRIRRDVLFTRTPSGVLFHNAHGGFNVVTQSAYRFASLIVPHLDGERRVDEICAGLGDKQRDMVVQLVRALYARGFARDAAPGTSADVLPPQVADRFAQQLAYLDHYADDAPGRFLRYRDTRVAVLGDDALARWAALGLLRNGCAHVAVTGAADDGAPGHTAETARVLRRDLHGVEGTTELDVEEAELTEAGCAPDLVRLPADAAPDGTYGWDRLDGWDTVLVTPGPAGRRQTLRLLGEGVPPGRRLLPAWTFGDRAVVGPVMADATPGCWCCAALRLGAGADAADSADFWASVGPAAPLGTPAPDLTGPLAGMLGNLLAFEVFRLVTGALPAETRNQLVVQDLDSLDVLTEPLLPHPRCPHCVPAELAFPAPDVLRTPHTDDEPTALPADGGADERAAQDALAALEARDILVHPSAGVFTAYADDDHEQTPLKVGTVRLGTGPGRVREVSAPDVHHVAGARLAALLRAAEVYAEHVVPPRVLAPAALEAASGTWPRVAPARLALTTGLDVPAGQVAHWSEAVSLLDGRTVLVPAAATRTLGHWNDQRLFEPTPAGTGAGTGPRAALTRALRSALTHDALQRALRRTAPVTLLDLTGQQDDPELVFLLRTAENLGVRAELLDLTATGGSTLPVVLARRTDPGDGTPRWAAGSGLRPREAVLEALRDLLGTEQLRRADGEPDTGDPLWADLDPTTPAASDAVPLPDTATTWAAVLDTLAGAGRDAFAVPVAAPDLAAGHLHTVKVLLADGERRAD